MTRPIRLPPPLYSLAFGLLLTGCTGTIDDPNGSPSLQGDIVAGDSLEPTVDVSRFDLQAPDAAPGDTVQGDISTGDTTDGGPDDAVTTVAGWQDDAALNATGGSRQVFLTWTPASGAVSGYRVTVDGQSPIDVAAASTELLVDSLMPGTIYTFKVEAELSTGWTSDGPQAKAAPDEEHDPGFRRLTRTQFNNTVADLHGVLWQKACDTLECAWPRPPEEWLNKLTNQGWGYWGQYRKGYPDDRHTGDTHEPRGGFRRLDQVVFDEHIASWMGATMAIAGGDYEGWVGNWIVFDVCKKANDDGITNFETDEELYEHCVMQFIDDFATRAYRRPLTVEEHQLLADTYHEAIGDAYADEALTGRPLAARGLRNVIAVTMSSPQFLYRVELGDEQGQLTAYEVASRLSYHFWNTMPDEALFAAAADGSLLTEAGYQAQVDRLAADPRARPVIEEFYRDFFRVQDFANIHRQSGPSSYHQFPNTFGNWANAIVPAMQDEVANLGVWFTDTAPGTFEDMFRSNLHFLECQWPGNPNDPGNCTGAGPFSQWAYGFNSSCTGADCYTDHAGWDGESDPVTLPESQRVGLLTRLGVLGHDTFNARPIRRGLYIREALLCEHIPPPNNCEVVKPPEVDVYMTTREKVEEITEQPETTCAGCHSTLINGFGHALGHFSSKGQYWDKERMFTDQQNAQGEYWYFLADEADWAEIDASGTTFFNGEQITINGAQELADTLANSGQMELCWSRQYFRFAMGRLNWDTDQASIDALADQLRGGATLAEGFKAIAATPQFRSLGKPAPAPTEVTP